MGIIDGTVLGLLIIAGIWGFIRGGKKKVTKLISFIGALTLAIVFYSMLGNYIAQSSLGRSWAESFADTMIDKVEDPDVKWMLLRPYKMFSLEQITYAFTSIGIPGFFVAFFVGKITIVDNTLAMAIGSSFVSSIIYAISFFVIFILAYLILKLLTKVIFGGDGKKEGKSIVNRLAGSFFSLFKMSILILIAMLVLVGFGVGSQEIREWVENDIGFNDGYVSIGGVFYRIAWSMIYAFILPGLEHGSANLMFLTNSLPLFGY